MYQYGMQIVECTGVVGKKSHDDNNDDEEEDAADNYCKLVVSLQQDFPRGMLLDQEFPEPGILRPFRDHVCT